MLINPFSFSLVVFYLCLSQLYNNLISQAGQVNLGGVPNDMIQAFSGVGCIIFGPILQAMYGFLGRRGINFPPVARMALGFAFCAAAMAYAAGFQHLIYSTGPCFDQPLACEASLGSTVPNQVNVWIQLPVYALMAVGEILTYVTAFEYVYNKSPKDIKTVVQALTQLTACVASVLGMAISPVAKDPNMVIFYACLAGAMALTAVLFWWRFEKYDRIDARLNELGYAEDAVDTVSDSPSSSSNPDKSGGPVVVLEMGTGGTGRDHQVEKGNSHDTSSP
jgi:POT family proton-dependent oligopeptide transporter